jgi:LPXTG-site transpeptidase (sortase) family protein
VLAGHNTGFGEVFRDLYRLKPGDILTLYAGQAPYVYQVSEVFVLREAGQTEQRRRRNARYVEPTTDERLTLVTCHPYGSLGHRLFVVAFPVSSVEPSPASDLDGRTVRSEEEAP